MQLRIGDHVMPVRVRAIVYWGATLIIALELAAGGVWDILQIAYVHDLVVAHLGYPAYFLVILGAWKIPGAVALLLPRFPRLTEWAYAGAFFTYTGAVASHLAVGDSVSVWWGPFVFAGIMLVSWMLYPSVRRRRSGGVV
jgi:DoxX-like protein